MAEPKPARTETGVNHSILVTPNGSPIPLTTPAAIADTISFTVSGGPVCIWTWNANNVLANIFVGETGNYVPGPIGTTAQLSFNTSVVSPGQSVYFQANPNPPTERAEENAKGVMIGVKGTISISSVMKP
jgi:hypothetical protein